MKKTLLTGSFLVLASVFALAPAFAGGQLETLDLTNFLQEPGPFPGSYAVDLTTIKWDSRCLAPAHRLNTVAAPNSSPQIDLVTTEQILSAAMENWNEIPTSFIEMKMEGEVVRPRVGPFDYVFFDFVNEVNFLSGQNESWGAISPSVVLDLDFELVPGMDLDGDSDSDVFDPAVEGIEVCADVDGDGDFEFPAGFYEAGTIVENDVSFNNFFFTWGSEPNFLSTEFDLEAIATHELGHSHGLSHTAVERRSPTDGTPATMSPGGAAGFEPLSQLAMRDPSQDDRAWSSFVYPEGTAASGPAALQEGDVAFDEVYGLITGEMTHGGRGLPLTGASVYAVDRDTGAVAASHYTGRTRLLFSNSFFGWSLDHPEFHLVHGRYTLPVKAGHYHLAVEPLDGPTPATSISSTTVSGFLFGLLDITEELLLKPGHEVEQELLEIEVEAGEVATFDHTTSADVNLDSFDRLGASTFFDFDLFFFSPPKRIFSVALPAAEVLAHLDAGLLPKAASYRTYTVEKWFVPLFPRLGLYTGTVADGGLSLGEALVEETDFRGEDNDFSVLLFPEADDVAERIREAAADGVEHFVLALEMPEVYEGFFDRPYFVGIDAGQQAGILGRSYFSDDGGASFAPIGFGNVMFRLVFGPPPAP